MELELQQPPINCYLHHAYTLTVAMSHKDFSSWFFSNYIQLEFNSQVKILNFLTYPICGTTVLCPLLDYRILDLEFIYKSNIDIFDFIKTSINLGYYVITYTDEFFIPGRLAYVRKAHFRHDIMIYGYSSDKSTFNVIGYNENFKYTPSCVRFSEFESSFLTSIDKTNDIILIKAKDSKSYNPSYEFDVENVKNLLSDYLFSKNTSANYRSLGKPNDCASGISVYGELIKHYESILKNDNNVTCDIKHFHLLYEHKKVMVSRLEYLMDNKYIDRRDDLITVFRNLQNEALNKRNVVMKYNATKNKAQLNTVIDFLHRMYEIEKKAVQDLLDALN